MMHQTLLRLGLPPLLVPSIIIRVAVVGTLVPGAFAGAPNAPKNPPKNLPMMHQALLRLRLPPLLAPNRSLIIGIAVVGTLVAGAFAGGRGGALVVRLLQDVLPGGTIIISLSRREIIT